MIEEVLFDNRHKFVLNYTISNFVFNTDDSQVIYFNLIDNTENNNKNATILYNNNEEYNIIKLDFGDTVGYRKTDLTYPGDLIANIVFNEIIDVAFYDVVPYVRASMRWSNFQMITKVKDGYQIKIMCEENTWAVFDRLYKESVELLSKKASKQIELRQTRK